MATTIESALVVHDLGSANVRRLRGELRQTRLEAEATGRALDGVGSREQTRQLGLHGRATRTLTRDTLALERAADRGAGGMGRLDRSIRDVDHSLGQLDGRIGQVDRSLVVHQRNVGGATRQWDRFGSSIRVTQLLTLPALAAGLGMVTQAAGGLAAGAVALTPTLGAATGAAAAAIPLYAGLGLAVGVTKLATQDLTEAYGGNERALRRLTPEGRAFLQVLRETQPEIARLRRDAQQGMFPGLTDAVQDLRGAAPTARRVVRQSSRDLGGVARFAAGHMTDPVRLAQIASNADLASRTLGAAGRSTVYLAGATLHLMEAAGPMTDWLSASVEGWAKNLEAEAEVANETGRLTEFFEDAERAVRRLWSVGDHTFDALSGLMRAASGEGDDLWRSIDRTAGRWDRWSNSFDGQIAMRRWFAETRPALRETVGLIGDLGEEIGDLTTGPGGVEMIRELRRSLPAIGDGVEKVTGAFGPAAVEAFGSGVELLGELADHTGPLTLLARTLGMTAEAVTALIQATGPLGPALLTAYGARALLGRVGVGGGGAGMLPMVLPGGRGGAPGGAPGGPTPIPVGALGAGVGAATVGSRLGLASTARLNYGVARAFGAGPLSALGQTMAHGGRGGAGLVARSRASTLLTAPGGAARLGAGAAKAFWPAALAMGAFQGLTTEGDVWDKAQGAGSGLTFGFVPAPISDAQREREGYQYADDRIQALSQRGDIRSQRSALTRLKREVRTLGGNDEFDLNTGDEDLARRLLRAELGRRRAMLRESLDIEDQMFAERSVRRGQRFLRDIGQAYDIRAASRGPVEAMRHTVDAALAQQRRMAPEGARLVGEQMLAWTREQARHNPALIGEVRRLEAGIKDSFSRQGRHVQIVNGSIRTGSDREWKAIRRAIVTQTERARQEASEDFTILQRHAVGSLISMGFDRRTARDLVAGVESGSINRAGMDTLTTRTGAGMPYGQSQANQYADRSSNKARGGRIPGTGVLDTVPLADGSLGAPGELIVNRHTEADIDRELRMLGRPTVDERVRRETRPHFQPPRTKITRYGPIHAHATGGRLGGIPDADGALPGLDALAFFLKQKFGLGLMDGRRPAGTLTTSGNVSDHTFGTAIDVSDGTNPTPGMDAAHAFLRSTLGSGGPWVESYAGGLIKQMIYRSDIGGNHFNHIHIALAEAAANNPGLVMRMLSGGRLSPTMMAMMAASTGGGGVAMQMPDLRPRATRLRGVPGALRKAAGKAIAAGLTARINEALGAGAGGGSMAGVTGGGFGGMPAGIPYAGGGTFEATAYGPPWGGIQGGGITSTGVDLPDGPNGQFIPIVAVDPAVVPYHSRLRIWPNPFGYRGFFQAEDTGGAIRGNRIDFLDMRGHETLYRWGRQDVTVSGRARGGRLGQDVAWGGWHADGVDAEVNQPTLFGAGEAGRERVTVEPIGGGRRDGRRGDVTVQVSPGAITINGGSGVTKRQVAKIVERHLHEFTEGVAETIRELVPDGAM